MNQISLPAKVQFLDAAMAFVSEQLQKCGCSEEMSKRIQLCVEEIFVNIASYAYPERKDGMAKIVFKYREYTSLVEITLIDRGIPYNPLMDDDPDITLSAQDRPIGGLGIYMVKRTMDEVRYKHSFGKNRLTMVKKIKC